MFGHCILVLAVNRIIVAQSNLSLAWLPYNLNGSFNPRGKRIKVCS
jgi:hypothetical protein